MCSSSDMGCRRVLFDQLHCHSATVKELPGQPLIPTFLDLVFALLFPVSGVIRGLNEIFQAAAFQNTPLEIAVRAGAVCEVVRTTYWRPETGDVVKNMKTTGVPLASLDCPQDPKIEPAQESPGVVDIELDNVISEERVPPTQSAVGHDQRQSPKKTSTSDAYVIAKIESSISITFHEYPQFSPASSWSALTGRKIHGYCVLPIGYGLAIVPKNAIIEPLNRTGSAHGLAGPPLEDKTQWWRDIIGGYLSLSLIPIFTDDLGFPPPPMPGERQTSTSQLGSFYSVAKVFIAGFQLIASSYTLYKPKGDQISRFGYAAFGLTVAPYLIMSGVDLIASLFTPEYSHVYLVETDVMIEAQRRNGIFEGVVGRRCISEEEEEEEGDALMFDAEFQKAADGTISFRPLDSDCDNVRKVLGQPSKADGSYILNWANKHGDVEPLRWTSLQMMRIVLGSTLNSPLMRIIPRPMRVSKSPLMRRILAAMDFQSALRHRSDQLDVSIPSTSQPSRVAEDKRAEIHAMVLSHGSILIGALPLVIVGCISGFQRGSSTASQRTWTMVWLAMGIVVGPISYFWPSMALSWHPTAAVVSKFFLVVYGVSAVGGMVVVAEMVRSYGNCVRIY